MVQCVQKLSAWNNKVNSTYRSVRMPFSMPVINIVNKAMNVCRGTARRQRWTAEMTWDVQRHSQGGSMVSSSLYCSVSSDTLQPV